MFNVTTKSMQWGEETLTLETGKVARQADGTVIATLGETSVMANVTFARAAGLKSARLDSLSGAPGYTVSSWVQPRTKARVIWVDNSVDGFASRDARY